MKTLSSILLFTFCALLLFIAVLAVGGLYVAGNRLDELRASAFHSLAALEKRCDALEQSREVQPTEEVLEETGNESYQHQQEPVQVEHSREDTEEARSDFDELPAFHFATSTPEVRRRAIRIKQRLYEGGKVTDEELRFLLPFANEEMRLRMIATAFDEHMTIFGNGGPAEYSASLAFALSSTDERLRAENLKRRLDAELSLDYVELEFLSQFAIGKTKQRIKELLILDYKRQFGF